MYKVNFFRFVSFITKQIKTNSCVKCNSSRYMCLVYWIKAHRTWDLINPENKLIQYLNTNFDLKESAFQVLVELTQINEVHLSTELDTVWSPGLACLCYSGKSNITQPAIHYRRSGRRNYLFLKKSVRHEKILCVFFFNFCTCDECYFSSTFGI